MGKPRKVTFEVQPTTSAQKQHYGQIKVGGEIVFSGELVHSKSSLIRTMKNMVKKIQDAGYRFVEVPVHHYYRQYGTSQFFNFARVGRTLIAVWGWWWRLIVKQEAVKEYQPKRQLQIKKQESNLVG